MVGYPFVDLLDGIETTIGLSGLDRELDLKETFEDLQVEHVVIDYQHLAEGLGRESLQIIIALLLGLHFQH